MNHDKYEKNKANLSAFIHISKYVVNSSGPTRYDRAI